ncbi:MAG: hypothetical protein LLG42_00375 [Chloroflexi bacterium]|nr:hypothetical protein [Chloroflexota bacterium]
MELSKAVKGFLISRDDLSITTVQMYTWALGLLTRYLQDKPGEAVTSEDLHLFFRWLREEYKPTRMNGDTSRLPAAVWKISGRPCAASGGWE